MNKTRTLKFKFVDVIPENIDEGNLYISLEYATAVHMCCCGCEQEVVTPLTPTDWRLIYDGETISLYPSIGNWSFACRSHYWIKHNRVEWAPNWNQEQIDNVKAHDKKNKQRHFKEEIPALKRGRDRACANRRHKPLNNIWKKFKLWLS